MQIGIHSALTGLSGLTRKLALLKLSNLGSRLRITHTRPGRRIRSCYAIIYKGRCRCHRLDRYCAVDSTNLDHAGPSPQIRNSSNSPLPRRQMGVQHVHKQYLSAMTGPITSPTAYATVQMRVHTGILFLTSRQTAVRHYCFLDQYALMQVSCPARDRSEGRSSVGR